MVRRSRLEIYFDVLRVINKGIDKPTQIMYKSNLAWSVLQEILDILVHGGFIKEEMRKRDRRYHITKKGQQTLSYHLKALDGLVDDSYQLGMNSLYIR